MGRPTRLFGALIRTLPLLLAAAVVGDILLHSRDHQRDFRTYYFATKAAEQNLDPYNVTTIESITNDTKVFPFLYPPLTLKLFQPIARLPYGGAFWVWLCAKLLLLWLLLHIWRRRFLQDLNWPTIILFCLFAFGAAISLDLRAGNVAIIECAFIWSAFHYFFEEKYWRFCVLLLLASLFKWTPALFSILLLISRDPHKARRSLAFALGFLVMLLANYLPDPELFWRFAHSAASYHESGQVFNPSMLSLMEFLTGPLNLLGVPSTSVRYITFALYLSAVLAALWSAGRYMLPLVRRPGGIAPQYAILTSCLLYALILPRFKVYSYIVLIPAALYVIRNCFRHSTFWPLLILFSLSIDPQIPGRSVVAQLWAFYPLFLAVGLWLIWMDFLVSQNRAASI